MPKIKEDAGNGLVLYPDRNAFLSDAEKELQRVKRYGGRVSFLIIETDSNADITESYEKLLYNDIKKILRACDRLYWSGAGIFYAILPDTPEGGGEFAALRLKKEIFDASRQKGMSTTLHVGLFSAGAEGIPDAEELMAALQRDLRRDRRSQVFFQAEEEPVPVTKKRLLVLPPELKKTEIVQKTLDSVCTMITTGKKTGSVSIPKEIERCVIIHKGKGTADHIQEKIRKHQRLKSIFNIMLGTAEDPAAFDLVIPEEYDPKFLCYAVLKAFSGEDPEKGVSARYKRKYEDALSAISAATHQLNQPLQIILGKMELLLLDLDSGHMEPGEIKNTLAEIRTHILQSADINQKINRLTKI